MGTDAIRLVRFESAAAVTSQAVYHAVGECLDKDGPDTILLVTPREPYVSIGLHQDASAELDIEACRSLALPIVRREVGGGAVYLDGNQVFVQWIFRSSQLPIVLADRYKLYAAPLIDTYKAIGLPAEYRPINDLHVRGRKIGGTGAARIGEAELVVGSLMFDFDHKAMSRILKVASEKMRDKVTVALEQYMTTLCEELGTVPDRELVIQSYLGHAERALARPIIEGPMRPGELEVLSTIETRLASDEWTFRRTSRHQSGVKIQEDVAVCEGVHKARAGLLRLAVVIRLGLIQEIEIFGDFTLLPQTAVTDLEAAFVGLPADPLAVTGAARATYRRLGLDAPGLEPEDFGAALEAALGRPLTEAAGRPPSPA
ncbi:MAG: lipoyl protein ligase domain-containing protein [Acidimicrobiales bacterium]